MSRPARIAALIAYVALIMGVTSGMFYARDVVAPSLDTQQGQQNWDVWRHDAADQVAGKGPVARREPKSNQPPLVVLMRDYFAVCLGGAILFSSLLFAVMLFILQGILKPGSIPAPKPDAHAEPLI
jgi:hypothetical protein